MSSTQSKTLTINSGNVTSYGSVSGNLNMSDDGNALSTIYGDDDTHIYTLNDAAKGVIFPNSTAHPIKADLSFAVKRGFSVISAVTSNGRIKYNGSKLVTGGQASQTEKVYSVTGTTDSAVTTSTKGSRLQLILFSGVFGTKAYMSYATFTLYFTRYDFSATAGSGVTSASMSSSTGYGGGSIEFSCVIPTGYVFDGWYKAGAQTPYSTAQSFTYTIPTDNAANYDLALTAKAHQSTHSVNGTYNGSTKAILTGITGDVSVGYNGKSKTLNASSASHTLSCSGKVMRGNVSVGSASLATGGKIMRSDLALNYV